MSKRVVIVGAGHGAAEMVAALRKEGWEDEIVIVGEESLPPYQRPPLSKAYLSGDIEVEKLHIRPAAFYEKQNVEIKLGVRVTRIDRDKQSVALDNGESLDYSYLCLATGTRARRLDMLTGADLNGICYLRTVADIDKIAALLPNVKKAVIVGGGYIGLETAASLRKKNIEVTVIEAVDRILQRVTAPVMSEFFARVHREEGVTVLEGTGLSEFLGEDGQVSGIKTSNGETIDADIVIVGVGIVVNDELATDCGLSVDNGVVVNDYCETDDEHILAIGDVTNHYNAHYDRRIRLESVPNANEQARIAAKAICGNKVAYNSLPWFWSDQYDIKLQIAGLSQGYDSIEVRGDSNSRSFCVYYLKGDELIAVDAINSPKEFMQGKKLIMERAGLPVE